MMLTLVAPMTWPISARCRADCSRRHGRGRGRRQPRRCSDNISSFEGGAGFFVVGIALLGLIGGFIIGLVTSSMMARSRARFGEALGASAERSRCSW